MKSSGRPEPGSSRKLAFLCPLLVKLPSAVTRDFDDITTVGELDRAVQLRAEDSGLGVQRSGRVGVFVFWLFQFIFGTNSCLDVCPPLVPSWFLVEPAD